MTAELQRALDEERDAIIDAIEIGLFWGIYSAGEPSVVAAIESAKKEVVELVTEKVRAAAAMQSER